tara:strand:- start:298 stop:780 length:483 start_codon:yes stop_codon:yes gene_type:complete
MKKESEPSYILIFVGSFISASLLLSDRYSIYYFLPSHRLFYIPGEPSAGNVFYEFFRWNLSLLIGFLTCFLISKISKNFKFSTIDILNNIKKRKNRIFVFIILGLVLFFPLLSLLLDYIDLSIGMTYEASGQIIKVAQGTLLCLWMIFIFTLFFYEKIKN